jgi:hypothetical protein
MTQPADRLPVELELPESNPSMSALIRMITDPIGSPAQPDGSSKEVDAPLLWLLGRAHPLAGAKIVRMYRSDGGGVDVYSTDGEMYVRTFIPERVIRFFDETMTMETFISFIADAEEDEEEPVEEEPDEEGGEVAPAAAPNSPPSATPSNGSTSS